MQDITEIRFKSEPAQSGSVHNRFAVCTFILFEFERTLSSIRCSPKRAEVTLMKTCFGEGQWLNASVCVCVCLVYTCFRYQRCVCPCACICVLYRRARECVSVCACMDAHTHTHTRICIHTAAAASAASQPNTSPEGFYVQPENLVQSRTTVSGCAKAEVCLRDFRYIIRVYYAACSKFFTIANNSINI